jgi:hypothetical protein
VPLSTTTDFAGNIGRGNIGENGNWENDVMSLVERKAQQDGGGNPVNPVDASGDDRRLRAGDCWELREGCWLSVVSKVSIHLVLFLRVTVYKGSDVGTFGME